MGRSLGSGAATYLASKRPVEKMLLISPFDSIKSVAQNKFPIYPMFLLLKDKYDSIGRVKDISAKTIVLIAENDEVIPKKHSLRLISEFPPEQLTIKTISDAGHNDISNKMEYYNHLKDFLNNRQRLCLPNEKSFLRNLCSYFFYYLILTVNSCTRQSRVLSCHPELKRGIL